MPITPDMKNECKWGHDLTDPANVAVEKQYKGSGGVKTVCVPCRREAQKRYRIRRKLGKPPEDLREPITYGGAHDRVKYRRGKAREHTCLCGAQAKHWSYVGPPDDPNRQEGPVHFKTRGRTYYLAWSRDVWSYEPMCGKCHSHYDSERRKALVTQVTESAGIE